MSKLVLVHGRRYDVLAHDRVVERVYFCKDSLTFWQRGYSVSVGDVERVKELPLDKRAGFGRKRPTWTDIDDCTMVAAKPMTPQWVHPYAVKSAAAVGDISYGHTSAKIRAALRDADGLSSAEIAAIVGKPRPNVASQMQFLLRRGEVQAQQESLPTGGRRFRYRLVQEAA